ncbi:MAG TPA: cupin domain-containing protein [Dehalococcoidia bacterium]|nr:cupin domain-containing protein [Dehalococcoidia bacterium]
MPLVPHDSAAPVEMFPGVVRRTLTFGERLMLVEVTMNDGAVVPMHTHSHEQTGYLVSGRFLFELGDERRELGPGDCWLVPSNLPHQVTALEPCVMVDVFSPPRDEYR